MKNKRIKNPVGLRKWVRRWIPRFEHFVFDVPWDWRTITAIIVLAALLAGIILLPVDVIAKWMGR